MIINLKGEVWKDLHKEEWRENEIYKISNFGRVISYKHDKDGKLITPGNVGGYSAITAIKKNRKNDLVYIHRAVAELFIENPFQKRFVIHKDFNKTSNRMDNLAWVNRKELTEHNSKSPKMIAAKEKRKTHRTYTKLTEAKVKLIKRKINDPNRRTRLKMIAKQFGISEMQLYRIKSGENWGSVNP
ncbi:NUMOD4 domain-containing protein [Galbibacter sp. EGI 63066]|uniref:NUMOD4 domain-containing protein n=1 Tax=Galbibacter sp. EGI 63066 TaxID=2993559 RepID=UPI00224908F7|nr:NUMOD4 domain-containing protein [Galbibacter sp. EGI 63066]MCX2680947.1 NUMOD4 domain-containing protein [Galbibacter sp. EGI 63066]